MRMKHIFSILLYVWTTGTPCTMFDTSCESKTIPIWRQLGITCVTSLFSCLLHLTLATYSLKENWYEFPERRGMPEVDFSSLFLCRITRCQRGSAPRPTQADRQAILCTWTRGGTAAPRLLLRPGKSGNWQARATGREVNIWTSWRRKGLSGGNGTCVRYESWRATELVGAAAVCCLSTALQITPQQYHSSRQ